MLVGIGGNRWPRDVCRFHFLPPIFYLIAPSKGVDTNDAIEQVLAQLENFLKTKRTKEKTVVKLKELGLKSQTGKLRK